MTIINAVKTSLGGTKQKEKLRRKRKTTHFSLLSSFRLIVHWRMIMIGKCNKKETVIIH